MLLAAFLFLIFTINKVKTDSNLAIFPTKPVGIEGENLEIRVDVGNFPFKSCGFFGSQNETVNIESQDDELVYWENKEKSSCKLLIQPMKNQRKGHWNASIVDSSNTKLSITFMVGMDEPISVETTVEENAPVGSSFTYSCGYDKKLYAKVFNPEGKLISEGPKAGIIIPFVRVQDGGTWICLVQLEDRIFQLPILVHLNVTSTTLVETTVEETEDHVNLLCRHWDRTEPCIFELPNGTIFAPREGVFYDKYSYYGTNIDYDCGITIKKPLEDGEKGPWKCMMASPKYASFLNVGDSHAVLNGSTKSDKIFIVAGTNLTIECNVRQPLTYCYVRSPIGRIFSSRTTENQNQMAQYTGLGLGQGDCEISISGSLIWQNESGTWMCGMGAEGRDDVEVPVEVQISESQFSAVEKQMDVNKGESKNLSCRSVLGYGLRYCRFINPFGRSFNMGSQNPASSNRYTYFGNGLEAGECGITIKDVQPEDFGTWTCATTFVGDQWPQEFRCDLILSKTPMSFGSLVGLSIALGFAGIAVVTGLIFWDQKRRNRRRPLLNIENINYQAESRRNSLNSEVETAGSRAGLYLT